jgi:uncharacterized membrane protein
MRVIGWIGFFLGVCVVIIAIAIGLAAEDPWFGVGYRLGLTAIISVPLLLIGWKVSHPKKKCLVCPNGCNITQAGYKFCGQCGSRLVRR